MEFVSWIGGLSFRVSLGVCTSSTWVEYVRWISELSLWVEFLEVELVGWVCIKSNGFFLDAFKWSLFELIQFVPKCNFARYWDQQLIRLLEDHVVAQVAIASAPIFLMNLFEFFDHFLRLSYAVSLLSTRFHVLIFIYLFKWLRFNSGTDLNINMFFECGCEGASGCPSYIICDNDIIMIWWW